MSDETKKGGATPRCPHCNSRLKRWILPDASTWDENWHLVCFNDDCDYYKSGWTWMATNYNQHASYRFKLNPDTGSTGPVPVWSPDALRTGILPDDGEEES